MNLRKDIIFRGWNLKDKYMTSEITLLDIKKGFVGLFGEDIIIMQYSGVKDRKGDKIFEGDFVKCESDITNTIFVGIVFFSDGSYYLSEIERELSYILREDYNPFEIVGNVYEGKKLLEK